MTAFSFYEFFAGGGMVRAGLGANWRCLFANELDPKKATAYRDNWSGDELMVCDIRHVKAADLPGIADMAWASFPCQDLSLAGGRAGLNGERSGTFWDFWGIIYGLRAQGRAPKALVLENVCGALTSHGGKDFVELCGALDYLGYRFGAVVIDAALFVPQSRPRLFIIATRLAPPKDLIVSAPSPDWHPLALQAAFSRLPSRSQESWIWWRIGRPLVRRLSLADVVEAEPVGVRWHTTSETERLLAMMTEANLAKVRSARTSKTAVVGTVYRRTRKSECGAKVQRAEVRFDGIAGCLRTPAGGSSRQTILIVHGENTRSRLMSPREAARLMGLPDTYRLPANYNDAYHLIGDGVAAPVVRRLASEILEPLCRPVAALAAAE